MALIRAGASIAEKVGEYGGNEQRHSLKGKKAGFKDRPMGAGDDGVTSAVFRHDTLKEDEEYQLS
jgi:hypothetical protein